MLVIFISQFEIIQGSIKNLLYLKIVIILKYSKFFMLSFTFLYKFVKYMKNIIITRYYNNKISVTSCE